MAAPAKRLFGLALLLLLALGYVLLYTKPAPIQLGLVAGLTGRVADLGIGCRNGALLAVEEWNRNGGINGRAVELLVKDDKQDEKIAQQGVGELIAAQVEAIIGPVTSAMSVATVAQANEARILMMSPTTTSDQLQGIDDYFFRVIATTREYAENIAQYLRQQRGLTQVAVIYDLQNEAYSGSYYRNFRQSFEASGGEITVVLPFRSGFEGSFLELARKVATPGTEGVLIIANSMDAASFCQQLRKLDPTLLLATSEWAATTKIVEIGGVATEGLVFGQFFDRNASSATYKAFFKNYTARFDEEPGFAAVTSYDAVNVVLEGLKRKSEGKSLKESLLTIATFAGVESSITLDRFGDSQRKSHVFTIRNGHFLGAE